MPINILLIDDERDFICALSKRLILRNYKVSHAFSGQEALNVFRQNKFDVILLDILMPGLNGLETYERIRATDPVVGVIILTAHAEIETAMNGIKKGVFDYMIKPVKFEELIEKIEMAYHNKKICQETVNFTRDFSDNE